MIRISLIACILFSFLPVQDQMPYDNCEDALDITSEIFHFGYPESCNSMVGIIHPQYGFTDGFVDQPTVDPQVYQSQQCIGYTSETTNHYPDFWLKSTLDEELFYGQKLFLTVYDTVQLAVYFGKCGELFQSQCFTLTPIDSLTLNGIELEFYSHQPDHEMYLQIKVPSHYQEYFGLCFSDGYSGIAYPFSYSRPATMGGETSNASQVTSQNQIELFPNPTRDWLYIRSQEVIGTYTITSLMGTILATGEGNENSLKIPIDHLSAGMYVFTTRTPSGFSTTFFNKL